MRDPLDQSLDEIISSTK